MGRGCFWWNRLWIKTEGTNNQWDAHFNTWFRMSWFSKPIYDLGISLLCLYSNKSISLMRREHSFEIFPSSLQSKKEIQTRAGIYFAGKKKKILRKSYNALVTEKGPRVPTSEFLGWNIKTTWKKVKNLN